MTPDGGRCARNTGGEPRQLRVFEVLACGRVCVFPGTMLNLTGVL